MLKAGSEQHRVDREARTGALITKPEGFLFGSLGQERGTLGLPHSAVVPGPAVQSPIAC
jgi:hypothetical protein